MYTIKILQNNKKQMVINDRMYDAREYCGITSIIGNEIPEAIYHIMDFDQGYKLTNKDKELISFWLDHIAEIDRRLELIIEVFQGNKKIFRKDFN